MVNTSNQLPHNNQIQKEKHADLVSIPIFYRHNTFENKITQLEITAVQCGGGGGAGGSTGRGGGGGGAGGSTGGGGGGAGKCHWAIQWIVST